MVAAAFAQSQANSSLASVRHMVSGAIDRKLNNSRAPGTFSAYTTAWNSYEKICRSVQMAIHPVTEPKLVAYAALAHDSGLRAETVRNYLCGIAFHHHLLGLEDPRNESSVLKLVISGCRREDKEKGVTKKLRLGISGTMLETIITPLDLSNFRAARWAAYASISYFAGLRANEIVQTRNTGVSCYWKNFNLMKQNPAINYFIMTQYYSKPVQFGPAIDIPIPKIGTKACPFNLILNYRKFFENRPELGDLNKRAAFMNLDGTPYTYRQALADTKHYVSQGGYDKSCTGTHCYRIGMASEAGRQGLPGWIIKLLGRWNSECYQVYIRTDPALLASMARKLKG